MKLVLLSAVLLATVSCSDATGPGTQGSVAFTFTGAGGGTFSASGDAPSLAVDPPTGTSWSVGYIEAGETFVGGSTPRTAGRVDMAILRIKRTTTGSSSIDASCDVDGSTTCTTMALFLNFNPNGDLGDYFCGLTSGTIVITEMSSSRAKGTFSGSGTCFPGTGGTSSAFTVSNGTFDVAMVTAPPA